MTRHPGSRVRHRVSRIGFAAPISAVTSLLAIAATCAASNAQADEVGAKGSSSVESFFGTFGTSIGIDVPRFHGIEPKLELAYNSQGRNGQVGTGWQLSGFPTIERASPGKGAPRYDGSDIFVLDGMELVPCTTMGGTHCSKIQNYQRITWDAANNAWYLWQKDGIKLTFSAVYGTGRGVFRWAVTSVSDPRGNTVNYGYWCDPGADCYPDQVSYNGTTIKLYREGRADAESFATGAGLGRTSYRIKTIDVTTSGTRVRSYKLAYATSPTTSRSLLQTVQQFGSDASVDGAGSVVGGSALPAVNASYSSSGLSAGWQGWATAWPGDASIQPLLRTGDFNGDGKTDLFFHYSDGHDWVGLSTGSGISWQLWSTAWPGDASIGAKIRVADFNGDGKSDLYFHYQDGNDWVGISNGSSFTWQLWGTAWPGDASIEPLIRTGDFNGDGKTDLHFHYKDGNDWVGVSNGSSITWQGWATSWNGDATIGPMLRVGDFNGDGKSDLYFHYKDGNDWVGLSNGSSITWQGWGNNWPGDASIEPLIRAGDFNGDGKTDLFFHYSDGNNWVGVSTGSGITWQGWGNNWPGDGAIGPLIKVGDFNGDGRTDLSFHYSDGNDWVATSTGAGFAWQGAGTGWGGNGGIGSIIQIGDFNGDGKQDRYFHWSDGLDWVNPSVATSPDLLTTTTNSLGGTTTVSYKPSSAWANTYLPDGLVMQTASAVTSSDGRGASSTTSYTYSGGLWSSSERRFLGFRKVTAVLDAAGNYTETYYHQHVGCVAKPETTYYRNASGSIYRYSTYGYTENASAPYTSLMTDRWEYECNLTGSCKRTLLQIGYDQYGNGSTTYEYGDYDVAGDERTSVRASVPNTGSYIVSLPAYENIYAGIGTGGALLKQTLFEYDGNGTYAAAPSKGLLTRKKAWNNQTGSYVTRAFGYDAWGNQTSETDERGSTSTTEFDGSRHVLDTRRCNALGQCSSKSWDTSRELINSETDLNGNVTSYSHDALGRPVTTWLPNGTTETLSYLDWGTPSLQRIRRTLSDGTADGLWTELYEDGLGRQYKQVKEGGLVQETLYSDASKRVWKKSGWYGSGETPQYQVFSFDGLGRIRTVTNPDGTVGQTVYGNDYVAAYDELGHEKVTWTDAYGQTTQVREKNGSAYQFTSFQHDLVGNLTKVTDAAGNITTVTWDSLGRKLMGCDPDTGCSGYTYDDGGLILTRSDAKGQLTSLQYDAIGRPVTKSLAGGSQVHWTYDEAGHGASKGTWTTISDSSGTESRSYDTSGRITSTTKCVGAVCATTGYSYDAAGRTASITYPDGEVVSYGYDSAGRVYSVSGYVNSIQYNARGQITSIAFANGTTSNYAYDNKREWLTSANVTGPAGTLFQMGYSYDAAARVTATTSSTNPLSALSFGYDDLNRVTTVSGGQSQSLSYDALGNITQNSAVGSYGYGDGSHRHAVTTAGANGFSYDANGNMLAGAGRVLSWNTENRLASVTKNGVTVANDYDFAGERVKRTAQGIPRYFFSRLAEYEQGVWTKSLYVGNMLVATNRGGVKTWYHSDHLGSTRLITDSWGQKLQDYDYAPFGLTARSSGSAVNGKLFGGHEQDVDSGLVYMHARYYDASLGRFISPDSLIPDPRNPQAFNRYAFVYNNPISNADPTGHVPVVAAVLTCASVGATVGVTSTAFAISVVGAATMTVGYIAKDPTLMSIGGVLLGAGSGLAFGAGFLGQAGTVQAAVVNGGVSLMTSPISPLDPKLKQAIGWAYTAQSLVYDFQHIDETIDKNAKEYGDSKQYSEQQLAALKDKAKSVTPADVNLATTAQRRYGEAMETMSNGAIKAGQAIALNPTGGIIGPDAGFQAQLLEALTGWMPSMRVHAVLHDAGGQLGNYPWAGNWFNLDRTSMLTGHIEGISRAGGASNAALYSRMYGW